MTYRFEEEDYRNTYILEDYYCTNPFCDCKHVTVSFCDKDNDNNRFVFLLNFNKTHNPLPNAPKWSNVQSEIIKNFAKNIPDELLLLFKQRYFEAKAYGEKNPMSYLMFEPGKYVNYIEMFPRNQETLDFTCNDQKYFAEDSYDLDPRNDNRDLHLVFYKFELDSNKQPPIFSYTYFFNEKLRAEEDAKLDPEKNDMVIAINHCIPDLYNRLKVRYKQAKKIGQELLKVPAETKIAHGKIKPNDVCPCGSGKKYKKCCALKLN
ncbi:MAG: SEC-C metal-binding domain-containing protein [Nitrospinaceae bacterium]